MTLTWRATILDIGFRPLADMLKGTMSVPLAALSAKTMKKTSVRKKPPALRDTMRKEYRFDCSRARPNRFAEKMSEGAVAVVLEPDVAAIFKSSEAVNSLLRSVIAAMPESKQQLR